MDLTTTTDDNNSTWRAKLSQLHSRSRSSSVASTPCDTGADTMATGLGGGLSQGREGSSGVRTWGQRGGGGSPGGGKVSGSANLDLKAVGSSMCSIAKKEDSTLDATSMKSSRIEDFMDEASNEKKRLPPDPFYGERQKANARGFSGSRRKPPSGNATRFAARLQIVQQRASSASSVVRGNGLVAMGNRQDSVVDMGNHSSVIAMGNSNADLIIGADGSAITREEGYLGGKNGCTDLRNTSPQPVLSSGYKNSTGIYDRNKDRKGASILTIGASHNFDNNDVNVGNSKVSHRNIDGNHRNRGGNLNKSADYHGNTIGNHSNHDDIHRNRTITNSSDRSRIYSGDRGNDSDGNQRCHGNQSPLAGNHGNHSPYGHSHDQVGYRENATYPDLIQTETPGSKPHPSNQTVTYCHGDQTSLHGNHSPIVHHGNGMDEQVPIPEFLDTNSEFFNPDISADARFDKYLRELSIMTPEILDEEKDIYPGEKADWANAVPRHDVTALGQPSLTPGARNQRGKNSIDNQRIEQDYEKFFK